MKKYHVFGKRSMYPKTLVLFNDNQFLGFYIKNSNKKLFYNQKYIITISNPITKPQFLTIIKLTYTGIKYAEQKIGHYARYFSVKHLNQL